MNKAKVVLWSLIALIAVGVGGFFGVRYLLRKSHLSAFETHAGEYIEMAKTATSAPAGTKARGKVITVDKNERAVDWLYFDLPEHLQANTPDEVGTIVLLEWGKIEVGHYGNNESDKAYRQTCIVSVYDKADKKLIGTTVVTGGKPPERKKRSASGVGPKPTEEIVNFVRNQVR